MALPPQLRAAGTLTTVTVQTAYDGNGNVTQRTDGNGVPTSYIYDAMNRLTGIDYPGGTGPEVTFTYDANGNKASMTDATGITTFSHDIYDRLTRVDYPEGGFVVYGYDSVGNITEMLYGNGKAVAAGKGYTDILYTYDADNRIASVKNVFANTTTSYTYDDAGHPLRRTLPNGVTTDYGYDVDGRPVSVDHKKADGSRICKYTYTLNAIGNRTQVVEVLPDGFTKTTSYTYDALDRLSSAAYPDGHAVSYLYDSFGNRTKMTEVAESSTKVTDYTYDGDSRLLSTKVDGGADETFSYDATGNLIQRVRASDNRQIDYFYDVENRLVRYFDGTNNVQYVYNGAGHRVAKIVNGARVNYVNDLNRKYVEVLAETDASGGPQRVYEWGNELIDQVSGATRSYHLHDAINGSIRRVIDSSGTVSNTYEYDAFGNSMFKSETVANDFKFRSENQDNETGLLFLRARTLEVGVARFLTRDPANRGPVHPSSFNPYIFAESDPVNHFDPSGLLSYADSNSQSQLQGALSQLAATPTGQKLLADSSLGKTVLYSLNQNDPRWPTGCYPACSYGNGVFIDPNLQVNLNTSMGLQPVTLVVALGHELGHQTGTNDDGWVNGYQMNNVNKWENPLRADLGLPARVSYNSNPSWLEGSLIGRFILNLFDGFSNRIGGVALNKSASVLLDINSITGGTYDSTTGQIILFGKPDASPTALPKMNLDDLAVAVRAKQLGTFPVVSIEDPVVTNQPQWPGRSCYTVRYGPFYTDSLDGQRKVLDVSSKTHFGWVMFEADRLMKSLGLGLDNRTLQSVSSSVPGYVSWLNLAFQYFHDGTVQSRFWFNPKEIVVETSPDGKSMQITKAEMQLSTETMFASNGQVESTPDAEYFATWFTNQYDAIAEEQVSYDDANQPHKIFKELKQLAYLAGVVKWIQDNNIPVDLGFLKDYQPAFFDAAPAVTPQTSVSDRRVVRQGNGISVLTSTITGGVNFCNDLVAGTGGNPTGLGADAAAARPVETALGWSFSSNGQSYNATALSVDRTEKSGGASPSALDVQFKVKGAAPVTLARYFDSFNKTQTMFGWGWKAQPYALEFKGNRETFSICHQTWSGYGEVWFMDRSSGGTYKFVPSGTYDKVADPQGLTARFDATKDILVYRYQSKAVPGLLFSDNSTHLTMKLDSGELLDFNFDGVLLRTEDRNGNAIDYGYDASKRLVSIGQAGGRTMTLNYDSQNRVSTVSLPGGRTVTYSYDASGNLVSAQPDAPSGFRARYSYDADHNLTQIQDENGNATATQSYDVYGRITSTAQPGVATPFLETYDLASRTSQMTGPDGASRKTEFNTDNDPTKVTDARGNPTTFTYNSYRDRTSATTPDGKTRQLYYDDSGRSVATVQPNNRADRVFYNNFGSPTVTFHAPVNAAFTGAFDADHVLTSGDYTYYTVDYTQFGFDAKGNRTSVTDANAHVRQFGYDAIGNVVWSKDARSKQTDFTYDTNTRLTRVRNGLGHQVDMVYDGRDNLTQVATSAGTVDFTYNLKNQVTSVTNGNIGARRTTSYTYDAKGKISTVTDPSNIVTQYAYDARGNLLGIIYDGISRCTYDYDGQNRLTATHYTGTAGGARASLVPVSPVGSELFRGGSPITIKWLIQGDWTANTNVTIQYSTDGIHWTNIATVLASNGSYVWMTPPNSNTLRIRFTRAGDITFRSSATAVFGQLTNATYYVNDNSTAGDQYCTAAGQPYNGTTVTGRFSSNPVNDPQAIFDNYALLPGDVIYIDTGSYALDHDILITEADAGTPVSPVTIQGPISGPGALLSRVASGKSNNAVIAVYDTDPSDSTPMQGLVIQNIKTGPGLIGIWFQDAYSCTISHCECSQASEPSAAGSGVGGDGVGIFLLRGGNHVIDHNICHHNGGSGGGGTTGNPGLSGSGEGIFALSSNGNLIRFNECYANQGGGGAGGSSTASAGPTFGYGIWLKNCAATTVTDNVLHDNDATGFTTTTGKAGDAQMYGLYAEGTTGSTIERNLCYGNDGAGGSSTIANGGFGVGIGMIVIGEPGARIANNTAFNNSGVGGLASTSATFSNGRGEAYGIVVSSCANATAINNLVYGNSARATTRRVSENSGTCLGAGLRVEVSTGVTILHNTIERNRGFLGTSGSSSFAAGAQILVTSTSTGATVKNNAAGSQDLFAPCISVAANSQSGFSSDYNDFYTISGGTAGSVGQWGTSISTSLSGWKNASSQDAHSLSVSPQYYDQPAGNYHLKSTSPLIGAAVLLANSGVDIDGENRPQQGLNPSAPLAPDIGFDEFKDTDGDTLPDAVEWSTTLTNINDVDSDHDGLPDDWEVANGLNPNDGTAVNGPNGDPDGDGYTNLQEFQGGANPQLASSIPAQPPVITSASPTDTNPLILEEDSIAFAATATDANGDTITYAWALDGVVKSNTSTYTFTTNDVASGLTTLSKSYNVELRVTAGADQVTRNWIVTVGNRNHSPVIQPIASVRVRPGNTIQLNPIYSDPDNQNAATGDDNILAVNFSGFMTSATKTVSADDIGLQAVTVTVQDNGTPGLSAQQVVQVEVVNAGVIIDTLGSSAVSVTEGGAVGNYTMVLSSQPTAPVTVTINADSQVTANPTSLAFTTENWNTAQTVTVTAVDDRVAEGAHTGTLTHTVTSADAIYNGVSVANVVASIKDRPIDDWRHSKFNALQLANAAISGDGADPNNNGISNLVEYALNGDPTGATPGLAILPKISKSVTTGHLQFSVSRYLDRVDLILEVQGADAPGGPWATLAVSINGASFSTALGGVSVIETGVGNARSVTIEDAYSVDDKNHPHRFLRLQVTRQ